MCVDVVTGMACRSEVDVHLHRAVVRPEDISVYLGVGQFVVYPFGCQEVVDAPASVLLARLEAVGPPRVDALLRRVEVAEGVGEARLQQGGELGTLFVGESGVATVRLGVLQVYFLMGHVEVTAYHHRLAGVELQQVVAEVVFPGHAVVQSAQLVLRVGHVDGDQKEVVHLQCDDASFAVVMFHVNAIADVERLVAGIDGGARVAFLLGVVPVRLITLELQVELSGLHLGFLQAEEVGIEPAECVAEAFLVACSQSVDVPGNEFHHCSFFLVYRGF